MQMKKVLYYILTLIIFLLSFRMFSSVYYPALNSDNAITILMIHYFDLPSDLYFWGQDRMGSLIPLVGQLFFRVFGMSALWSEAITHYLILLAGYFAFAHFIKSLFYKIIWAIIWFFPPMRMMDVTQFAFGVQYSLIAISCYLFSISLSENNKRQMLKKAVLVCLNVIVLITAIWVNDMAMITVFILLAIMIIYHLKSFMGFRKIFSGLSLWLWVMGIIAAFILIFYAKSQTLFHVQYAVFGNINLILSNITIFFSSVYDILFFRSDEFFTGLYSWMILVLILILILNIKNIKTPYEVRRWIVFFAADALLVFTIVMLSEWTALNGVPRRYFSCTYVSLAFIMILLADSVYFKRIPSFFFKSLMLIAVLTGGAGSVYHLKYVYPGTLVSKAAVVKEAESLGQCGIIGDYWNSYILSITAPEMIKATQNDVSPVRKQFLADEALRLEKVYIVKDMWLEKFPDTIRQFGHVLIKTEDEFIIAGCYLCCYKKD